MIIVSLNHNVSNTILIKYYVFFLFLSQNWKGCFALFGNVFLFIFPNNAKFFTLQKLLVLVK